MRLGVLCGRMLWALMFTGEEIDWLIRGVLVAALVLLDIAERRKGRSGLRDAILEKLLTRNRKRIRKRKPKTPTSS